MRISITILLSLLSIAAVARAQRDEPPVELQITPVFGERTLLGDAFGTVRIDLVSRRSRAVRGELEVTIGDYASVDQRHVVPIDLPPGQSRRALVTLFVIGGGAAITARLQSDGRTLAVAQSNADYAPARTSIVVLGDPPRLRSALLDLDVLQGPAGAERVVRVPIGVVRYDARTSDPILPAETSAWSSVGLLVLSGAEASRASPAERAAIVDWLRAGGRALVFVRNESDLAQPFLREAGVAARRGPGPPEASMLAPREVPRIPLDCGADARGESFGCSVRVGHGRVYLADYDGSAQRAIDSAAPRDLVRSIYARDEAQIGLAYGRDRDLVSSSEWEPGAFARLRGALDPNEGFRPALGLVALVLFVYVVLVGPINFTWVQRKNRPALALLTTPLAALGCLLIMLGVGYVGKGVRMRYRRVELVEAVEGEPRAPARRYTGLFSTRPGSFSLAPLSASQSILRLSDNTLASGPVMRHSGRGVVPADLYGGLWETVFVREDRMIDLGGSLRFESQDQRLARVHNETRVALEHAIVLDTAGAIYTVGDVPAGGSAPIALTAGAAIVQSPYDYQATAARELAAALGASRDEQPYLQGLLALLANDGVPRRAPVLYARLPASGETIAGQFDVEVDQRWLRLVPALAGERTSAFRMPLLDEYGVPLQQERVEPVSLPEPARAEQADAGVPSARADGGAP